MRCGIWLSISDACDDESNCPNPTVGADGNCTGFNDGDTITLIPVNAEDVAALLLPIEVGPFMVAVAVEGGDDSGDGEATVIFEAAAGVDVDGVLNDVDDADVGEGKGGEGDGVIGDDDVNRVLMTFGAPLLLELLVLVLDDTKNCFVSVVSGSSRPKKNENIAGNDNQPSIVPSGRHNKHTWWPVDKSHRK
jgi:hypothetical protein